MANTGSSVYGKPGSTLVYASRICVTISDATGEWIACEIS